MCVNAKKLSLQTYLNEVAYFLRKNGFNSEGGGSYGSVPTPSKFMIGYLPESK